MIPLLIVGAVALAVLAERGLRKGVREVIDHDPATCVVCQVANTRHP